jgi:hypothetical protein
MRLLTLLCALVASMSVGLSAQSSDWSVVRQIGAGMRIRVQPRDILGSVERIDADRLVIRVDGKSLELQQKDIRRVEHVRHRAKSRAWKGFLIGTALGTILWRDAGGWAPLLGTAYGGLFAGVAAISGRFARSYEPVYENPVP